MRIWFKHVNTSLGIPQNDERDFYHCKNESDIKHKFQFKLKQKTFEMYISIKLLKDTPLKTPNKILIQFLKIILIKLIEKSK